MKYFNFLSVFAVLVTVCALPQASADLIFDATNNGDFQTIDPTNAPNVNPGGRRAANPGSFFFSNWAVTTTGFGGRDTLATSGGDASLTANSGVALVEATAFSTPAADSTTAPTGGFLTPLNAGDTIDWSFEGLARTGSDSTFGTFDYLIELDLDGAGTFDQLIASGTYTDTGTDGGFSLVSGSSGPLTASGSEFNVRVSLINNTGGPADQVGIDDIILNQVSAIPEPGSLGILAIFGLASFVRRYR